MRSISQYRYLPNRYLPIARMFNPLFYRWAVRRLALFTLCFLMFFLDAACKPRAKGESSRAPSGGVSRETDSFNAGQNAQEFLLADMAGTMHSLRDYRGKVVLLNFWATWCPPCVAEMPALERLYQTYRDRGFEIVSINVDPPTSQSAVIEFIKENGLNFTVLRDPEMAFPPRYGITGFPESFFVDSQGKFIAFLDPQTKDQGVRIVSDRPWDSQAFIKAIGSLLDEHRDSETS